MITEKQRVFQISENGTSGQKTKLDFPSVRTKSGKLSAKGLGHGRKNPIILRFMDQNHHSQSAEHALGENFFNQVSDEGRLYTTDI